MDDDDPLRGMSVADIWILLYVLLVQDTSERLWLSHAGMQSELLICFLLCILLAEHIF